MMSSVRKRFSTLCALVSITKSHFLVFHFLGEFFRNLVDISDSLNEVFTPVHITLFYKCRQHFYSFSVFRILNFKLTYICEQITLSSISSFINE